MAITRWVAKKTPPLLKAGLLGQIMCVQTSNLMIKKTKDVIIVVHDV